MKKIKYELLPREEKVVLPENLGFGLIFTDHVFEMDYSPENGWHNPAIRPLQNLNIHPATMFIHYGQALFEGLKAYKTKNDEIVIFRPDKHFQRFNNSAKRLCMPEIDIDFAIEALKELISIERDWIPKKEGESLYIRPFMFGVDPVLGVRPSSNYKMIIMLSPVGAYYPEGFKPVKILIQDNYVRAVRKGMGECKTPGNYAASLLGAEMARKEGYTQCLWLDAVELKYIEEVGTMNIFITLKNEVVTPKLTGGILPGVTRASVIHILKDWGVPISERQISMEEFLDHYHNNNILGVFGTGTAAVISSVSELKYKNHILIINKGQPGDMALRLFSEITSIQYGRSPDKYGWLTHVASEVNV